MSEYMKRLIYRKYLLVQVLADFIALTSALLIFFDLLITLADNPLYRDLKITYLNSNTLIYIIALALFHITIASFGSFYHHVTRENSKGALKNSFYTSFIFISSLIALLTWQNDYNIKTLLPLYYTLGLTLFVATFSSKLIFVWWRYIRISQGKIGYNTLIVGSGKESQNLLREITTGRKTYGNILLGYVKTEQRYDLLANKLNCLGTINDMDQIINTYEIDEIIIATRRVTHLDIETKIGNLHKKNIVIKVDANLRNILAGVIKTNDILGPGLLILKSELMSRWQKYVKVMSDYILALLALIIISPILLIIAIALKITNSGSILYKQERLGRYGNPFYILKFRTMVENAEPNGPALSSTTDPRVTPIGRYLRKWRLDELPQFINVLRGEMSLVGPRPDRAFFAEQLIKKMPHYQYLSMVKPGITSWGMVKFGYAESVEEMMMRAKYDIIYLENMSLLVDFKIVLHTIRTLLLGRGR